MAKRIEIAIENFVGSLGSEPDARSGRGYRNQSRLMLELRAQFIDLESCG